MWQPKSKGMDTGDVGWTFLSQAAGWTAAETSVSIPVSEAVVAVSMSANNDTVYAGTQQCSILQLTH